MKIWNIVKTQVLVAPLGGVYALNLGSITQVLTAMRIDDIQGTLERLEIIFQEVYGKK